MVPMVAFLVMKRQVYWCTCQVCASWNSNKLP